MNLVMSDITRNSWVVWRSRRGLTISRYLHWVSRFTMEPSVPAAF